MYFSAQKNSASVVKTLIASAAIFAAIVTTTHVHAADDPVVGLWRSIDDKTNKPKSLIRISESNGVLSGKIEKLFRAPTEDQAPVCIECSDERKDKPVIGMTIIRNLKKENSEWVGGDILDPQNGRVYRAKVWMGDGDKLNVRGSIGPFGRTQVWVREGK